MTPLAKFVVKCVLFGVYSLLTYLTAARIESGSYSLDALVGGLIAAGIAGLGYAGIGAATPLEHPKGET